MLENFVNCILLTIFFFWKNDSSFRFAWNDSCNVGDFANFVREIKESQEIS